MQLNDLSTYYQITAGSFIGIILSMTCIALIDAKALRKNDYFRELALISVMLQTTDVISDCFFVLELKSQNELLLFYASSVFIVLPALLSLFQLYHHAKKHWLGDDKVNAWISTYFTLILMTSFITGSSFASVVLFNSHIFGLKVFDMGLTNRQLRHFKTKSMYSIVLFEVMFG